MAGSEDAVLDSEDAVLDSKNAVPGSENGRRPSVTGAKSKREPAAIEPTVFVIDSDEATCQSMLELAATMNLRCETFSSGQAFLEAFDPVRRGCVVLELRIPGMSGLQIQQYLRTRRSPLPLIFLTANATVSISVKAMRSGALTVLEKPIRDNELWDAIELAMSVNQKRWQALAEYEQLQEQLALIGAKDRLLLEMLGRAESKQAIAEALEVGVRSVELRQNRLIRELGYNSLGELMRFAILTQSGIKPGLEEPNCRSPWLSQWDSPSGGNGLPKADDEAI